MRDSDAKRDARERTSAMASGYVYLGQFIDHDLTRDKLLLCDATPDVAATPNYRTARLDLDLLYGKNPSAVPCIYEGEGRLKLGLTQARKGRKSTEDDLPRQRDGTAILVDPRNDENLIVAQMHVLFAKFHNRTLDLLKANPSLSAGPVGASSFEQARRFVTWHYQWIIVNDFLPGFVKRHVLNNVFKNRTLRLFPRVNTPDDSRLALPVEFTAAAFRFGHSMVQEVYLLNTQYLVPTKKIIEMTKNGGGIGPTAPSLPADFVIDWDFFFRENDTSLNRGENIDTFIAEALYELSAPIVELFRARNSLNKTTLAEFMLPVPELTLRRGSKIRLPAGEEFARTFGFVPIAPEDIGTTLEDKAFFSQEAFRGRTPLWYYLLREASFEDVHELEPGNPHGVPIQKLGTIGSQIVAEVFLQILAAESTSILNAGRDWSPPKFGFGSSTSDRALDSMPNLVDFIQSTEHGAR